MQVFSVPLLGPCGGGNASRSGIVGALIYAAVLQL
jgi:hypothetical protein